MNIERLQLSIQTVKDNITILERQEPEDAGWYLQLEHEKMVLEALEKQMPKKPKKEIWVDDEKNKGDVRLATKNDVLTEDNHTALNLCPNCNKRVLKLKDLRPPNDRDYYCRHCGQAIDWSAHPTEKSATDTNVGDKEEGETE